jgi:hypothetical protein
MNPLRAAMLLLLLTIKTSSSLAPTKRPSLTEQSAIRLKFVSANIPHELL